MKRLKMSESHRLSRVKNLIIEDIKMKKTCFSGLVLALAMCFGTVAQAGVITDIVNQNVLVNGFLDSHSYRHNINDDGFVLGSAFKANLKVQISDDGGFFDGFEIVAFIVEGFDFDTGSVQFSSFDSNLEVKALGALNADGFLDVTVRSLLGDFYVGQSVLTVYKNDPVAAVPEPSTLALLGLGLAGLGLYRRKAKA